MDDRWITWAKASFAKYFKDFCDNMELDFTLNAIDTTVLQEKAEYLNLRISGPNVDVMTQNESRIEAGIEILLHILVDDNIYTPEFYKGKVVDAMFKCIPMLQLGFNDSDSSQVSIFQLKKIKNPVRVLEFFNKDQLSRIREISFTAPYEAIV